ncbi:protein EARLY-RESPONSIVE TO DEHYDRATION 7, chloroplastic-like [Ananas comosus]|uniref:Protein EARLY-RESPONSIVE TO DEHYDRATION 7, chloroplastic-like n=1 Tax=Ananas comosus TaxID=4615 RepID=A0A6P5H2F1_ANACO|nr:protein EARLY-RESPONSIVE TO DEHYDRATION 7, chloroplastic-like [Ananas comosus]XP_020115117.1 protein EARLY-RESPONSIVE TO DEHYDRATION 7, chloroplastic-like [Ananas comosus]
MASQLSQSNNPSPSPSAPPEPSPNPPPTTTPSSSSSSSLYPSLDMADLVENLFPDTHRNPNPNPNPDPSPVEETLLRVPGAILHLIDERRSVPLASGDLYVIRLRQGDGVVAVLAGVSGDGDGAVQWPLGRDAAAAVRLDGAHYFFALRVPEGGDGEDVLSYGLTFASKGQEALLAELDRVLGAYTNFSVQKVAGAGGEAAEVLDGGAAAGELAPAEVAEEGPKREMMEKRSAAYWTTLAPNVEEYSGYAAKAIAVGSGQVVKGILWCGDVTVDRIRRGNELLKKRMGPNDKAAEVSPETLKRIKRVKRVTKMSEKVATGILSGVVKVSGYFTSSVVNSKAGKKFFGLLPGEIVLASLEGFGKICDAVEVAGKNVLSTSSDVTTGLVSHRYGDQAAEAATEGLDAAGHAIGTAWAVFKIRKAIDPKSSIKPTTLARSAIKAAAAEIKANKNK